VTRFSKSQRGGVLILVAAALPVLLGFAALAVDIVWITLARSELQRAADAAALAGAGSLTKASPPSPSYYNWPAAEAEATLRIQLNNASSTKESFTDGDVSTGWWNISSPGNLTATDSTVSLQDGYTNPSSLGSGTWLPAVRVRMRFADEENKGPLGLLFAKVLGFDESTVTASSVALIAAPTEADQGALFPFAINKCIYDLYWDKATNTPTKVQPMKLGNSHVETGLVNGVLVSCTTGEWTTFKNTSSVNTNDMVAIVKNGNPVPVNVGELITTNNGVAAAALQAAAEFSVGKTFMMPVVDGVGTSGQYKVIAFAPIKITTAQATGNPKFIEGQLVGGVSVGKMRPGLSDAPYLGGYIPPMLAF
jgi:Flp pilus assembly protein TadG